VNSVGPYTLYIISEIARTYVEL